MAGFNRVSMSSINQNTVSEYQPWGSEFERLDKLLKAVDELAINVRSRHNEYIEDYFIVLYQIYMMLKPYMSYNMKKLFRHYNSMINDLIEEWREDQANGINDFPTQLVRKMTYYHEAMLVAKHRLGLSLPVQRQINFKSKMKHALLGKG